MFFIVPYFGLMNIIHFFKTIKTKAGELKIMKEKVYIFGTGSTGRRIYDDIKEQLSVIGYFYKVNSSQLFVLFYRLKRFSKFGTTASQKNNKTDLQSQSVPLYFQRKISRLKNQYSN